MAVISMVSLQHLGENTGQKCADVSVHMLSLGGALFFPFYFNKAGTPRSQAGGLPPFREQAAAAKQAAPCSVNHKPLYAVVFILPVCRMQKLTEQYGRISARCSCKVR